MPVLLAHQQSDGGFATYTRAWNHGAWTLSQPEVTATVLLALLDDPGAHEPAAAAARYLHAHRRADGLWPSYWWTSPLYATDVALAGLGDDTTVTPDRVAAAVRAEVTATAFDLALKVSCLRRLGDTTGASAAAAVLSGATTRRRIVAVRPGPAIDAPARDRAVARRRPRAAVRRPASSVRDGDGGGRVGRFAYAM